MKIKLISDIHLDAHLVDPLGKKFFSTLPKDGVDVLVLAGDIVTNGYLWEYLDEFKWLTDNYKEVVFVLGNHDYYSNTIENTFEVMNDIQSKLSNLHWLQNTKKEIDGVTFAGTTLWFPEMHAMPGKTHWVDFRNIKGAPESVFAEHYKAKEFIEKEVKDGEILITHHIPHKDLVHPMYKGDSYNCYFLGDVSSILHQKDLPYVFFGHSHQYVDKQIRNTQYILNPRGYPYEWGTNSFNPDLIIDTDLDKIE